MRKFLTSIEGMPDQGTRRGAARRSKATLYPKRIIECLFFAALLGTRAIAQDGTWETKGSIVTGRTGLQAEAVGGVVYAIGGTAGGCPQPPAFASEAYDPVTNTWTPKATLAPPPGNGGQRTEFATAVMNGKIYAFGGGNCLTFFRDVQVYDPTSNSWSVRNPMPTTRVYGIAAAVNGKIYLIGGLITDPGAIAATLEYDPSTETWITKAAMPTARIRPGAAVIGGKIYVVGGQNPPTGVPVATVEAYDPATNIWTSLASMSTARVKPAVGVGGNRLYAFGGSDSSWSIVDSGETYDPASNSWSAAPRLPAARSGAGVAALGGMLYVIGGQSATVTGNATNFAFTPSGAGRWSMTGSMATPRLCCFGGLVRLAGGEVLAAGGWTGGSATSSAEVYEPGTGRWSAAANMTTARRGHIAVSLRNGKVLVAGGASLATAELYDPMTDMWSATGSMSVPRYLPAATLLPNGKVFVVGGYDPGFIPRTTAELYDPATGTWTTTGSMATGRVLHAATLLSNNKVLVTGGWNGGPLSSAEVYDAATGTWSSAGAMLVARDSHTATVLPDGRVLLAGGETIGGIGVVSAELYDPGSSTWSATTDMSSARMAHSATLLASGRVLVAGGLSRNAVGTQLASAGLYDPATGAWSATGSMASARNGHGAALLNSGLVLVAGGEGICGEGCGLASAELYDPAQAPAVQPPVITSATTAGGTYAAAFSYSITATNTPLSFGATGLPAGLSLNVSTGEISGTPAETGSFSIGLSATNAGGTGTATLALTIAKAGSTTTVSCPASVTFNGAAQTPCTATVTGAGSFTSQTVALSYSNNVFSGTATVSATYAGDANHTDSSDSETFTIAKAGSTTTVNCPASVTYDGAAQTPCTATVTGAGGLSQTLSVSYTNNIDAGTATASASYDGDTNHSSSSASANFTIMRATPVILWPAPADIIYGTPLSASQLNATAIVLGSFAYSPPAGTVLNAGAGQTLSTTFTPSDTANYTTATKNVIITVLKATPVITWPTPADIIYGTALSGTELNASANVSGTFIYMPPAGTVLSAGSGQTLSTTFTPSDTANYNMATKTVAINVLTPSQATQQLGATVIALVDAGVLTSSEAGALTAKLDAALQAINKGNSNAAKGQLGAFINQVKALVKSNRLIQAQADRLIDAANAVIDSLGP